MKKTRIILSIFLCFVFLFVLSSCEKIDAKKLEAEAALKLLESPYILNTEMNMSYSGGDESEDADSDGIKSSMSMNVDGTNFKMTAGSGPTQIEYVFADKNLYINMMGTKLMAEMSEEDVKELLGVGATGISKMSECSFSHVETEKNEDGKVTVRYKGLEGDENELISSLLEDISKIGEGEETVELDKTNFEYIAVIDQDGRYESMNINFIVNTSVDGDKLSVSVNIVMRFDYENAVEVNAPEDADEYYDVGDIGDIIG